MRILIRYQLRELVVPLVLWLAFLFLLLFVMQFLRGTDVLLGSAVTLGDIGKLTVYLLPHFLVMALPVAFLMAILLGVGRLAEDRELTAMHAVGIGPMQLLWVPLGVGAVLAGVMILLYATSEPWGMRMLKSAANELIKKNLVADVKPGVFYDDISQLTLYTEQVEPQRGQWSHVLIHDDRDPQSPFLVLARHAAVDPAKGEALRLLLSQGQAHRASRETLDYTVIDFDRGEINVGVEGAVFSKKQRFQGPGGREGMTLGELRQAAADAAQHGEDARGFLMSFHWRMGQALSLLAFALFGTSLAMGGRAGHRGRGFIFTLGGYVVYHVLARIFEDLGGTGRIPPMLAGQIPNLLFAAAGAFGLLQLL